VEGKTAYGKNRKLFVIVSLCAGSAVGAEDAAASPKEIFGQNLSEIWAKSD